MNEQRDTFEQRTKDTFDKSVDALDAATLSKLNRGRHEALAQLEHPQHRWSRWMPATGAVAAVLVAVVVLQSPSAIDDVAAVTTVTDMEILLGEDSIEMLEDLEFYSWIDIAESEGDVG
jgi:transcription initiation factor TFIIIB Brf1 subunit/transcription initiation factor TFIIB